jgi:two-component system sensor histidine kinase/response regulator
MMGLLLSEKGYNYDTASNGLEAVEAVQSQTYDIVLMDLQMPLMNGFDATRKIRDFEAEERHVPIVALTAMLFDNEIQECLNAGMDECVAKPFDTDTLFRLIASYVEKANPSNLKVELQDTRKNKNLVVLDIQGALPRFSEDIEVYKNFLNEFVIELPGRIERFRSTFNAGDYLALADSAHNLKGISASMGANQLAHLSQMLDQICQSDDTLSIQQALEDIERHVSVLREEADNLLSGSTRK